ncbi:MAG: hypothetical protein M1837_000720 [Sclerophora amabilis]|nr:MAG: hypothetical protein M1837_000720 [Sclerophora amabilis]
MAWSFWAEDAYRTHFFCALCGGPFAHVYRTNEPPKRHTTRRRGQSEEQEWDELGELRGHHTIPSDWNETLSQEELDANAKPISTLEESLRRFQDPPPDPQNTDVARPPVRRAYDGSLIQDEHMRWTTVIRALIHENAQVQPEGGPEQVDARNRVYLTGRGRVREEGSYADAHPTIAADLEYGETDDAGTPVFYDTSCQFHLYQEPDREDRRFVIGSIPFHENCWEILYQAIHSCRSRRGLPDVLANDIVDLQLIWSYLCEMLPVASSVNTSESIITRLSPGYMGDHGYREAQACGEGKKWLHQDDLHWLVANPYRDSIIEDSFRPLVISAGSLRSSGKSAPSIRRRLRDPFCSLPFEILQEVLKYLSCWEAFQWRASSVPVAAMEIPPRIFWRFLNEELRYVPDFLREMESVKAKEDAIRYNWKLTFESVSRGWRTDQGLRNRRRIWKIVEPMADELVERSRQNIERISGLDEHMSTNLTVVRGNVGVRSGSQGDHQTVVFAKSTLAEDETDGWPSEEALLGQTTSIRKRIYPSQFVRSLHSIHVWLDPERNHVRGMEFIFLVGSKDTDSQSTERKFFGNRTALRESIGLEAEDYALIGFNVCWYGGYVQGIQFVFEDPKNPPIETGDVKILSHPLGCWNGPSRRLVAPRKYRNLAGVTGYVNALGCIETFAILEEKIVSTSANGQYTITPPDTVPLSHHQSSLWDAPPPSDVQLEDRVGPTIGDWKTRAASCEVFVKTSLHDPPGGGRLEEITGFAAGDFLVGLRFQYRDDQNNATVQDVGQCLGSEKEIVRFEAGDVISVAIISYSDLGIHSLQIILSSGRVGRAIGSRYLGTRTVFIEAETFPRRIRESLGIFQFLKSAIIGFHCLYSPELERFLQLGVVTSPEPARSGPPSTLISPIQSSPLLSPSFSSCKSLPFLEKDRLKNSWVDGAPPKDLTPGRKHSDSTKMMTLPSRAGFAGWVSFREPFSRIVVYGQMEGIRFSFLSSDRGDLYFGNTASSLPQYSQTFAKAGSRITCIARTPVKLGRKGKMPERGRLPNIQFLSSGRRRAPAEQVEVESEFLAGIQFSFTATALVDWHPLFDFNGVRNSRAEEANRLSQIQNHWKSAVVAKTHPLAETDSNVLGKFRVLADFFDGPRRSDRADGVKGYVNGTRLCGLRFRRHGLWDEEPLGQSSAFERTFLLKRSERFVSLFVAETMSLGGVGAMAFCTNLNRVSPWFGMSFHGRTVARVPPKGRKAVGVYMAFSKPNECEAIGVIHEEADRSHSTSVVKAPSLLPSSEVSRRDFATELEWVTDPQDLPPNHRLSSDIGMQEVCDPALQRAFTVFAPDQLNKIEAFVNSISGRFGLKGLRFIGSRHMGTVILNDWQDQYATSVEDLSLNINGSGGERIIGAHITFHLHRNGKRIIGFLVKTNRGRQCDLARWSLFTDEEPLPDRVYHKEIQCGPGEEVVGLHYVFGPSTKYVHDIGLITKMDVPAWGGKRTTRSSRVTL